MITIDASNQVLGRLATKVATILRGKDKSSFVHNKIVGDKVTVFNADKISVTGNKAEQKKYYRHSGYLGHLKAKTYQQVFDRDPRRVIEHAVAGMLPKNRLRKEWLKRLTIITGPLYESNKS